MKTELSENLEIVRQRWPAVAQSLLAAPLIAVDAALKPLTAAGIVLDVVVTIDGNAEVIGRFFRTSDLTGCKPAPLACSGMLILNAAPLGGAS